MRTKIAIIRLVLRTNKVLSTGEYPIMLRCSFHGMKEVSTGYSCSLKYWNKKEECILKGYPSYMVINHELKKMKDKAIQRRDRYISSDEVYSPSMILDIFNDRDVVYNELPALIQQYIDERGLEGRTIEKWWCVYRSIRKYIGRDILINEINEAFCRRYSKWLENEGLSNGSIRSYLGKIGAICHYAIGKGLMSDYPFNNWKYHLDYRESKSELYIHSRSMEVMMQMFLDEVIERDDNGLWHYRDGVIEQLMDIHSELYSHYLYCIGYYLKGIAPTDISLLRKVDLKVVMIKGISCWAIDGYRSKTGCLYKIRLRKDVIESQVLINTMLMFGCGEYFLPTLNGFSGNIKKRVNNLYTYHSEHLVEWFRVINAEIVRRNVMDNDDIPLIDLECRYYSYRHSFIMGEIQKPNVNLLSLATSTGKSVNTLHQYISLLGDIDLIG